MSYAESNAKLLEPYYKFIVKEASKLFGQGNTIALDLANDTYLTLSHYPTEKIQDLINTNKIEAYIYTTLKTQRNCPNTKFSKLYKREPNYIELPDKVGHADLSFENLKRLTDFENKILALYVRYGTYDEASKRSRINKRTLIKIVHSIITKLK